MFNTPKDRVTTLDIDLEDQNSRRGGKLRKDRQFVKNFLKFWIVYSVLITVLTITALSLALKREN